MSRRLDEKHSRILSGLLKLPENKKCFDCPSKVNVYANLFNNTFICEKCSGLHRELNHRVKSISASTFTPEEVSGLQKGGNGVAKSIWLATWSWREYPEPDAHEVDEVRQFMRAKYVKKQWYQDPNGGTSANNNASEPHFTSPQNPSAPNTSSSGLAVPDRVRAVTKSQSVDNLNMIISAPAVPEKTLSRKSSTISSDSGSTISKSTNLSSAASSPFNAVGSKNTQQQQHQQQQYYYHQQQQYQQDQQDQFHQQQQQQQQSLGSFDTFASLMTGGNTSGAGAATRAETGAGDFSQNYHSSVFGSGSTAPTFVATPAALDPTADPFSLMTSSFNNMHMSSPQSPTGSNNSSSHLPPTFTSAHAPPSQTSMLSQSRNVFNTLPITSSSNTQNALASLNDDPFSLSKVAQPQNPLQGLDYSSTMTSSLGPAVAGIGAGSITGTKSFDDYLSVLSHGQHQTASMSSLSNSSIHGTPSSSLSPTLAFSTTSASASASLSPQSTGGSNPFSKQQMPQLQRAFMPDYPQSAPAATVNNDSNSNSAGQQSNPFAMFAKQQHAPTMASQPFQTQASLIDPFGRMQQQAQDYFSSIGLNSTGTRSPNPFAMTGGQQQQPQNLMTAASAYPSSANFESAFSLSNTPRSMTAPASTFSSNNNNNNVNDMFGQWTKPLTTAATAKYPSIDDLDPFSTSAASTSNPSASFSNPFSLNM
ncbi:hypothetical protein BCR41DRAFT_351070 [Lobosporangium transversale]|uniref:Arf-GAP domain-containing protein n=1 Tax=Lobosporangium transversale TaxID=64571 RepID=A0A1Y2GR63_9FUNG|nr:hypothetical protein BCR41DRAFT_351070 [Lobosporangium transversale]ORZ19972.1 hypothetical protein BCR41DRAFT_351070 [Lobosporangium transversale]|eukprot:XP_021882512.1 hypothetical protein BCR41DRAFT_351070 [Lobosporangium transversale]